MPNDEAEDTLDFELPVDKCNLEDSDFGLDENNEIFANKEIEKENVPSIPFKTKQTVVE